MHLMQKSLVWALISIPISWFGLEASFALAHGSLLIFMPFVLPGFVISSAIVGEGQPESTFTVVFFASQYVSYAIIIFFGIWLKRKYSKTSKNN